MNSEQRQLKTTADVVDALARANMQNQSPQRKYEFHEALWALVRRAQTETLGIRGFNR